jgi:hypothetical protein
LLAGIVAEDGIKHEGLLRMAQPRQRRLAAAERFRSMRRIDRLAGVDDVTLRYLRFVRRSQSCHAPVVVERSINKGAIISQKS